MSDTHPTGVATSSGYRPPTRSRWVGLVVFAGAMMLLLGFFQAIAGLAAIFNDDFYRVAPSGLVINVDYSVWGWVHLILGAVIFLAGVGVMNGNPVARVIGIVLAVCSSLLALAFSPAQPVWSIVVITVDVLVIYALTVHGHELEDAM